ncbi:MAG: DUF3379 family protein [Chromatiales bacterium]
MINCLEFRRHCLADPNSRAEDFIEHAHECRPCRGFLDEVRQMDAGIAAALQVEPPAGLAAQILLRQSLRERPRWRPWFGTLALAASLLLAVALTLFIAPRITAPALETAVFSYVATQPAAMAAGQPLTPAAVSEMLRPYGLDLKQGAGPIQSAKPCQIRGRNAVNLVMAGEKGPINILVMPEEPVRERAVFREAGLQAVVVPCPKGSYAIVGAEGEALEAVEQRIRAATVWL